MEPAMEKQSKNYSQQKPQQKSLSVLLAPLGRIPTDSTVSRQQPSEDSIRDSMKSSTNSQHPKNKMENPTNSNALSTIQRAPATAKARETFLRFSKNSELGHVENALDIILSPPVSAQTLESTREMLRTAYGAEYSDGKMILLFAQISDDGWSEERFQRTLKWFLRNVKWAAWTIADWFSYTVPIYNYAWYTAQSIAKNKTITWELAPGIFGWTETGVDLPFKNVTRQ